MVPLDKESKQIMRKLKETRECTRCVKYMWMLGERKWREQMRERELYYVPVYEYQMRSYEHFLLPRWEFTCVVLKLRRVALGKPWWPMKDDKQESDDEESEDESTAMSTDKS